MTDPMLPERPVGRGVPIDIHDKDGKKVRIGYATNEYTRDVFRDIWNHLKAAS